MVEFDFKSRYELALDLLQKAGAMLREALEQPLEVSCKQDPTDLVTNLDYRVQDFLVSKLSQVFPEDTFLAEEMTDQPDAQSGTVWILDPIDGTNNLVAQRENFAIMLAFFRDGQPGFAFIYDVMGRVLLAGYL